MAAQIAVGTLGLTIDEFEAMTPREYEWRLEGKQQDERRALLRTAQLAVWVMNPWMTPKISVGDLVALRPEEQPQTDWSAWVNT